MAKRRKRPNKGTKAYAKWEARLARKHSDTTWSKTIRDRDGNKCVVCGRAEFLDAHHLLAKEKYPEYRHELMNGVCVCKSHHKFGKFSAHKNGCYFSIWMMNNKPEQWKWVIEHVGVN